MKYALLIKDENEKWQAILKTDDDKRLAALTALCQTHLAQVKPHTQAMISYDRQQNALVEMHPDKDFIIDKLRDAEFPLPKQTLVIEGEYERIDE